MKYKHYYLAIFVLVIFACQNKQKDTSVPENIKIDLTNILNIKRSEIFSLNRIIKLENHPESTIGRMWDLLPDKKYFLVIGEDIGLYDKSGSFLHNIGKKGKGPGEYVSRLKVLQCNDRIRILDRTQQKIIDYDINGTFIDEYFIGMFGQSFICWNSNIIVYIGNQRNEFNKRLFMYNDEFVMQDSHFSIGENHDRYMHVFDKTNFFVYADSLRFLNAFDYYIHNVDVSKNSFNIKPRYFVDFGKHKIPKTFFEQPFNDYREYIMALEKSNYAYQIFGFFENKSNVYFTFAHQDNYYMVIYSKESQKAIVIERIIDDVIFEGLTFSSVIDEFLSYYYLNNQVYFVMDAYKFLDNINKTKKIMTGKEWKNYKTNNPEIIKLYNKIDKNDNPIIFVFDLKPFTI